MEYKKKLKVYLAGKISANGWRQKIIDIRNNFYGMEKWKIRKGITVKYNDNIEITGPFFLSCDHSCYHGNNSHGVGLNNYLEDGEIYDCYGLTDSFTEKEVNEICLKQIAKSDILFAYIDSNDCYGTIAEIGYAKGLGKKIIILFDSRKRMRDMWFIAQLSNKVEYISIYESINKIDIKNKFDELIYNE